MEKDIVDGKFGEVGQYDIEFKGGYLQAKVGAKTEFGVEADLVIKVGADAVIDAIAKAIPGQVDDAILGVIKQALKM